MRDDEQRAERERRIPVDLRAAAARSAHLMAAAHSYIATGDHGVWARCLDALRADCERLSAELGVRGFDGMTLAVGPWPEGEGATAVLTRAQEVALLRAVETQRVLFGAACMASARGAPSIVVRVD